MSYIERDKDKPKRYKKFVEPKLIYTAEMRKAQNKLNKDRAKRMERYVAAYLDGKRSPMSGADASMKGDGYTSLGYENGICLFECKLSAATYQNLPCMRFDTQWYPKLIDEVTHMRSLGAKFGFFVLKFLSDARYYVVIPEPYVAKIRQLLNDDLIIPDTLYKDYRFTKSGKKLSGPKFLRDELLHNQSSWVEISPGKMYITDLYTVKAWIDRMREIANPSAESY